MTPNMREVLVNRIISGVHVFPYEGRIFLVYPPTLVDKAKGEAVYLTTVENNRFNQIQTQETIEQVLIDSGVWSMVMAAQLAALPKEIDNLKVDLFHSYFKSRQLERVRRQLRKAKQRLEELTIARHSLDDATIEGVARLAKNNYLMSRCLRHSDGSPLTDSLSSKIIERASVFVANNTITEIAARELARTDPWKGIWVASKVEGSLFGQPATLLTDEQKSLILWSRMYDSIYESLECPPEPIINDNDVLDGWLIAQNRNRESEQAKRYGESHLGNLKGGEVFIPVETLEDARKVDALNTAEARRIKTQRFHALQQMGRIAEQNLPDAKNRMRQQAREQLQGTLQRGKRL